MKFNCIIIFINVGLWFRNWENCLNPLCVLLGIIEELEGSNIKLVETFYFLSWNYFTFFLQFPQHQS